MLQMETFSTLCVMHTTVVPSSAISRKRVIILPSVPASNPLVASSRKSRLGSEINSTPRLTRFSCPPERLEIRVLPRSDSPSFLMTPLMICSTSPLLVSAGKRIFAEKRSACFTVRLVCTMSCCGT